jgi:tripartite-type tricarboxylate transporter receptor subunit TctC
MQRILSSLGAALLALSATVAAAQAFPTQPVNLVVNFPPGGLTDLMGRSLAQAMGEILKQPVVVQNKGGAGGAIGVSSIAMAPKNGYTTGFVAVAALTTLPQMRDVNYRIDSLDYVCRTFDEPVYLLVAPSSPFRSAKALIDYAKAHPNKLNYATVGPGSLPHLAAVDFATKAQIDMAHIPYQGEAPAVTALLGKQVEVYFGTSAVAATHQLRRLAVAAEQRVASSPTTPTLSELGYPVIRSISGGIIAPEGIDPAIRATLEAACAQAVKSPQYLATLKTLEVHGAYAPGADFKAGVLAEAARNRLVLRDAQLLLK